MKRARIVTDVEDGEVFAVLVCDYCDWEREVDDGMALGQLVEEYLAHAPHAEVTL